MPQRSAETWDRLTEPYKRRLGRAGITRERYLSGEKLTGGRGHAKTPERPERATKHPKQYRDYINKRVKERAHKMFIDALRAGTIHSVDLHEVDARIDKLSVERQAKMLDMSVEDWRQEARRQRRGRGWVKIDNEWVNPFWYH